MKMTHKSLVQRVAERGFHQITQALMKHPDTEYKMRFHQIIEREKIAYELTPPGYARDVILGTYNLLVQKYEHHFGEKLDNVFHRRIQQDINDLREITRWHRKRIYGSEHEKGR